MSWSSLILIALFIPVTLMANIKWIPAGHLKSGTVLKTNNGQVVRVVSIGKQIGKSSMYNLTVKQNHDFFIGKQYDWVLVHNGCFRFLRKHSSQDEFNIAEIDTSTENMVGTGSSSDVYNFKDGWVVKVMKQHSRYKGLVAKEARVFNSVYGDNSAFVRQKYYLFIKKIPGKPISQIADGELKKSLVVPGGLVEKEIRNFHGAGWAHGDIQANNIHYDMSLKKVYLVDFALSSPYKDNLGTIDFKRLDFIRKTFSE